MTEYILERNYDTKNGTFNTVKREEIVRCRDCKHYRFIDRSDIFQDDRHNDSFCLRFVDGKRMEVEPDGFCAWGERKVEDEATDYFSLFKCSHEVDGRCTRENERIDRCCYERDGSCGKVDG